MVSSIRNIDVDKVLKAMQKWKISEVEKKKIPEFIKEYRVGRITGRIGKNIDGTSESIIYNLKLPLEYLKKDVAKMTEDDIKKFFDALMNDKLKKKVRKRINGRLRWVNNGDYAIKGKIKFIRRFLQYLKYRLEDKPEKLAKFEKILKIIITTVDHDPDSLTEKEVEELHDACSESWQRYFIEVNSWGGFRAGEFFPLVESDIKFPDVGKGENFVKIWIRNEHSKTKGRMVTLYGRRCYKIVKDYLEKRKREGLRPDEPIFEKSYNAIKIWLRRFGDKVLGKKLHHHLFRHTAATWIVNKSIIKDRHRLCLFFGWKFSSPMPDVYLSRSKISMEEIDEGVKNTELDEIKNELDREKETNKLKQDKLAKENKEINTRMEFLEKRFREAMSSGVDTVSTLQDKVVAV